MNNRDLTTDLLHTPEGVRDYYGSEYARRSAAVEAVSSVEEAAHSTGTNRSGSRESRGMFRQSARWMETPRPRVM